MLSLNKIKTQIEEIKINSEIFKNNLLKIKNSEFESLSNQKLTLEERLIKLERQQKDRILESPISGTILKTEDIYAGSVISPGTTCPPNLRTLLLQIYHYPQPYLLSANHVTFDPESQSFWTATIS